MSAAGWHLIGSAGSLDSVLALLVERWHWSSTTVAATSDPKVWSVASGNGPCAGLRIRQAGRRYRLEAR